MGEVLMMPHARREPRPAHDGGDHDSDDRRRPPRRSDFMNQWVKPAVFLMVPIVIGATVAVVRMGSEVDHLKLRLEYLERRHDKRIERLENKLMNTTKPAKAAMANGWTDGIKPPGGK